VSQNESEPSESSEPIPEVDDASLEARLARKGTVNLWTGQPSLLDSHLRCLVWIDLLQSNLQRALQIFVPDF